MGYENNDLCEICIANGQLPLPDNTGWYYWINTHCIELRRNRKARENKNVISKESVF